MSSGETVSTSAQHFADPGQVHERRLHPRIFPKTLVYVACGAANGGMVLNASDGGLAISMAIAVGGESFSNMLVRMNGLPRAIEANGRIVWTNVSRKRAGIQLLDVTGAQRMNRFRNGWLMKVSAKSTSFPKRRRKSLRRSRRCSTNRVIHCYRLLEPARRNLWARCLASWISFPIIGNHFLQAQSLRHSRDKTSPACLKTVFATTNGIWPT